MTLDCAYIVKTLKDQGVKFSQGLKDDEIIDIETLYNFKFPPDLKEFLMYSLPVSKGFINWRDNGRKNIKQIYERLESPLEGIIFDIENNSFWIDNWGKKPELLNKSIEIATKEYYKAPKLIPIYFHRYIPAIPCESGNPVYSVHQTDIIFYGKNLENYFMVEFDIEKHEEIDYENIKEIPFWSNLVG